MATVAGTIYLNGCNYQLQYDILKQSQENNTTTVRFYGVLNVTNNWINWDTSRKAWVHFAETSSFGTYFTRGSYTLVQGDFTFTHNSQGDLTISIGYGIDTSFVSGSNLVNIPLPHINRVGVIQSFVGNDLSGNFSATYTTYVSGYTYKLRISIPNVQELIKINDYQSGIGVNLDTTALNYVKSYLDSHNTNKVIIGGVIETYSGTTKIGESQELKNECSFIDGQPTFTYTTTETNENIIELLGSSASSVVKNVSIVRFAITPTAKYGATISKTSIIHDNKLYDDTTSPYSIDVPVTSNEFTVEVQDNRTNKTTETTTKTLIDYLPVDILNFSFKRVNPTSSNIIVNLESTYYQQTFGSTANVPVVKWKLDNGNWTTIPSTEYTIDNTNHKLTISNYTLTNALDYRQKGTFTIYIEDQLTTDQDSIDVIKGKPSCKMGEHSFQVNGTLYIADQVGENKFDVGGLIGTILWTNSNPTQSFSTQNITLSSSDYDVLEFYVKSSTAGTDIYIVKTIKSYGVVVETITELNEGYSQYTGFRQRHINYTDDTHYSVANCLVRKNTNQATQPEVENDKLIPLYVVGYKTGLFE